MANINSKILNLAIFSPQGTLGDNSAGSAVVLASSCKSKVPNSIGIRKKSVKSVSSCTERLTVSPKRSRKKNGEKVRLPYWRNRSSKPVCFQDVESPKSKSILRKGTKFLWLEGSVEFSKNVPYARSKFGKERVHRKVWFNVLIFMSVAPRLQNLRTDLRKKPWSKNDASAELRGQLPDVFTTSKKKTKLPSTRFQMFGHYQRHPRRDQRKEHLQ